MTPEQRDSLLYDVSVQIAALNVKVERLQAHVEGFGAKLGDVRDTLTAVSSRVADHTDRITLLDNNMINQRLWRARLSGMWLVVTLIAGAAATVGVLLTRWFGGK